MRHYYLVTQGDYGTLYEASEIEQLSKPIIDYWLKGKNWYGFPFDTNKLAFQSSEDYEQEYIVEIDECIVDTNSTTQPFILASLTFNDGVYSISKAPLVRSSLRGAKVWTCISYLGTDNNWQQKMYDIIEGK